MPRFNMGFLLALVLALAWLTLPESTLAQYHRLETLVNDYANLASVSLVFLSIGLVALGGPRQAVAVLYGIRYGFVEGAVFSTAITLVGALFTFYFAQYFLGQVVARKWSRRLDKSRDLVSRLGWRGILAIRLFPVGSNLITNILSGVLKMNVQHFLWGSFLGYLPQMLIFSYLGSGLVFDQRYGTLVNLLLLGIFCLSIFLLYRVMQPLKKEVSLAEAPHA